MPFSNQHSETELALAMSGWTKERGLERALGNCVYSHLLDRPASKTLATIVERGLDIFDNSLRSEIMVLRIRFAQQIVFSQQRVEAARKAAKTPEAGEIAAGLVQLREDAVLYAAAKDIAVLQTADSRIRREQAVTQMDMMSILQQAALLVGDGADRLAGRLERGETIAREDLTDWAHDVMRRVEGVQAHSSQVAGRNAGTTIEPADSAARAMDATVPEYAEDVA